MSLRKNIINLFISQWVSYIVPILQFPLLTRVLGTEEFGLYVFSYGLITFSTILTNYGFELYLPKEILERKLQKHHVNRFLTESSIIRLCLLIVSGIGLWVVYNTTDYYIGREGLLTIISLSMIFNAFSLNWLYQAKEAIYLFSRISVVLRIISVGFLFLFVQSNSDLPNALIIVAATNLSILFVSYYFARITFGIYFVKIDWKGVWSLFTASFEYFMSRVGVSLYASLGSVVIGTFSGSLQQVAYYGISNQLYSAGLYSVSAAGIPLLPYMVRTRNYHVFFKVLWFCLGITLLGSVIGILLGDKIISLIYGPELLASKAPLNIFMITIILSVLSGFFGYPALLPLKKGREANLSVIYAGLSQVVIISLFLLCKISITATTVAIAYLICELVTVCYRGIVFLRAFKKSF